jgi:hypothetical protein
MMDTIEKLSIEEAYNRVSRWGAEHGIDNLVITIGTMGVKFKELDPLDHKAYRMVCDDIQKTPTDSDSEGGIVD